jgi:hypothetical protein
MAREPHRNDPPLRGRLGLLPLDVVHRPTAEELAFDKVGLRIKATLRPRTVAPSREVFEHYRDLMCQRAEHRPGQWSVPLADRAVFKTHLLRPFGTITNTTMWVRWEDDVHTMSIWLNVNPTRTLRHLLVAYPDESFLGATLDSLPLEQFFGVSPGALHPPTLDGNDNAFDDLTAVRASMGENHAAAFLATFERQVRRWVCQTAAPHEAGFREVENDAATTLLSDHLEVDVPWWQVATRDVEVYFERWRPNAPTLMNRINHAVLAGHAETDWRHHDLGERGGRGSGSTSLGVRQTKDITVAYYAKTETRIRGEVRYRRGVRDVAAGQTRSVCNPLHSILTALRHDAVTRLRWEQFCRLAEPAPAVSSAELARLASLVSDCARRSHVDAETVLRSILETGGVTETPNSGSFPRRLNKKLEDCGVLWKNPLLPRTRPNTARRYVLAQPFLEIVRQLQFTLSGASSDD